MKATEQYFPLKLRQSSLKSSAITVIFLTNVFVSQVHLSNPLFFIAYTSAPHTATLYTASKPFPIDPVGFMTMFGFALTELLSPVTDCD